MTKYGNTLKMLGVSGKDAIFFDDALNSYHLTISDKVKEAYLKTMMTTVIKGKTLEEWIRSFEKEYPIVRNELTGLMVKRTPIVISVATINVWMIQQTIHIIFEKNSKEFIT